MNSSGLRTDPCRTPNKLSNTSECWPLILTFDVGSVYVDIIALRSFPFMPLSYKDDHMLGLWILSYALDRSRSVTVEPILFVAESSL